MRIKAALYNADHLEYGLVTIPFPIPQDQYNDTIKMLEALDIGDPRAKDCMVEEIEGCVPSLKCLEGHRINVDELDYLVKRLDSFSDGELVQFQGMAAKMGLSDMTDLINLTFCCQQATVITDFSDLEQIGRDHYMNLHGGCVSMEELEELDGMETALLLISENEGTVPRRSALCHSLFLLIGVEQTAVVLVQSLQDYANSQAKPQDEVLQGHGATDLVLCVDEPEQQCFFLVLQQSGEFLLALC